MERSNEFEIWDRVLEATPVHTPYHMSVDSIEYIYRDYPEDTELVNKLVILRILGRIS